MKKINGKLNIFYETGLIGVTWSIEYIKNGKTEFYKIKAGDYLRVYDEGENVIFNKKIITKSSVSLGSSTQLAGILADWFPSDESDEWVNMFVENLNAELVIS
jgi:hypothetical protein